MILILPDDLDALDDLDIKTAFRWLKHDEGHHVPKELPFGKVNAGAAQGVQGANWVCNFDALKKE